MFIGRKVRKVSAAADPSTGKTAIFCDRQARTCETFRNRKRKEVKV